jgi:hypothetical protein
MPTNAYDVIRQAIIQKQFVTATYRGLVREMAPHMIGRKNGRAHALFYQFGGQSSSGLQPDGSPNNWRCVFVDDLSSVVARQGAWHTAPNHSRPQTCVDEIDVEVAA